MPARRPVPHDVPHTRRYKRMVLGCTGTLTLGCMGGAILPLAGAYASTGLATGLLLTGVVALTNVYTTRMLLKQVTRARRKRSCEQGRRWTAAGPA